MDQRKSLGNRAYLMPIIFDVNDIWIAPNEIFYMTANAVQMRGKTFLMQNGMKYMGSYELNFNDQKELHSMLPNFQLKIFHKWIKVKVSAQQYQNEVIFYPFSYYGSFGQVGYLAVSFQAISPKIKKYKEWLGTDNRIFMKPYIKKIPKTLKFCEELFDEDVLTIKQLVKDIGDLNNLIHKKKLFYMTIVTLSVTHFLLNLIKILNLTITLQYDYNKKNLKNWKNKLSFKINQKLQIFRFYQLLNSKCK